MSDEKQLKDDALAESHRSRWRLGTLLLLSFAVRAWQPSLITIEHFDEGVYASNYFSEHLGFRYPDQHLYAPPLLPALFDWVLIFTGGHPDAMMWVNVVFGTLLVWAIWWCTRLMAGNSAALIAAAIASLSGFLIDYSRAALTETPVSLLMVLAVGFGLIALRDRNRLALVAASVLTAGAWWTKYNGWLPLAITGAGLAGWIVFDRPAWKHWASRVVFWILICVGAFLLWSPYLNMLEKYGGYSAVAANHKGYLVGLSGWMESAFRQIEIHSELSKMIISGIALGIVIRLADSPDELRLSWLRAGIILGGLGAAIFIDWGLAILICLAIFGLISLRSEQHRRESQDREHPTILGWWMLLAWVIGMTVSIPFYQPYPRLMMPWHLAMIIACAIGIDQTLKGRLFDKASESESVRHSWNKRMLIGGCFALCIAGVIKGRAVDDRTGFRKLAEQIASAIQSEAINEDTPPKVNVIYVLGEPGLYFHLASQITPGLDVIAQPAQGLGMLQTVQPNPEVATYLVAGPHAEAEQKELPNYSHQTKLIKEFAYQPSRLVKFDNWSDQELEENSEVPVELWKIVGP
ncbi:glycosyltransferase family 39 protein [Thalassoglobus neptunius]|uniref:glycosyltransferase family 39 protein n=1 Tax=Thalassoglobus neptunius TaxID=1938619 RepID=UPI0018D252C2|nr:glycosyltransferase family 39 protein [Thalassoglobus neptunius]